MKIPCALVVAGMLFGMSAVAQDDYASRKKAQSEADNNELNMKAYRDRTPDKGYYDEHPVEWVEITVDSRKRLKNAKYAAASDGSGIPGPGSIRRPHSPDEEHDKKFIIVIKLTVDNPDDGIGGGWTYVYSSPNYGAAKFYDSANTHPWFNLDNSDDAPTIANMNLYNLDSVYVAVPATDYDKDAITFKCEARKGDKKKAGCVTVQLQKPTGLRVRTYSPAAFAGPVDVAATDLKVAHKRYGWHFGNADTSTKISYKVQPDSLPYHPAMYLREKINHNNDPVYLRTEGDTYGYINEKFYAWALWARGGLSDYPNNNTSVNVTYANVFRNTANRVDTDLTTTEDHLSICVLAADPNAPHTVRRNGAAYPVKPLDELITALSEATLDGTSIFAFTQELYCNDVLVTPKLTHEFVPGAPHKVSKPAVGGAPASEIAVGDILQP